MNIQWAIRRPRGKKFRQHLSVTETTCTPHSFFVVKPWFVKKSFHFFQKAWFAKKNLSFLFKKLGFSKKTLICFQKAWFFKKS